MGLPKGRRRVSNPTSVLGSLFSVLSRAAFGRLSYLRGISLDKNQDSKSGTGGLIFRLPGSFLPVTR
jgi:hypothetical protein